MAGDDVRLRDGFAEAVGVWTNSGSDTNSGLRAHWLRPGCTVLQYARHVRCRFPAAERALLSELGHADFKWTSDLHLAPFVGPALADQAVRLVEGMLAAIDAACALRGWLDNGGDYVPDEFIRAAARCVEVYQQEWPLCGGTWSGEVNPFADPLAGGPLNVALRQLAAGQPVGVCGYLALRRLLEYLLDPALTEAGYPGAVRVHFETAARFLLYREDLHQGVVGRLAIHTLAEGCFGVYLDPVAMGLTLVQPSMIRSLQAAWRLCEEGLRSQIHPLAPQALAIRLSPGIDPAAGASDCLLSLDGESAGLLFACGMYAAARRTSLDTDATTSVCLDFDRPGHLLPVAEGSVSAKLQAAREFGFSRVILESEQAQRHRPFGERLGLRIPGAGTLEEAFQLLTGDARMERVLLAFSEARRAEWERACQDPEDPDGLTHYIEPHYGLLCEGHRPFDMSERLAHRGDGGETAAPDPYQRVPGDGDAALANLLGVSPLLCVTEDAGTGKTILTRRVQAWLSTPDGCAAVTGGRTCLAVRWESDWPEDPRQGLGKQLREACAKVDPSLEPEEVADWALRQHRVVLILDALDQVLDGQRLPRLAGFLESEAGRQCRVLMTSRSFEVPQKHHILFRDPRWRFARIEGFDEKQQASYLRGLWPDSLNDRDGLKHLIPNVEEVADLLRLPVVLRLVRQLAQAGQLGRFRVRGDLYLETSRWLLERAAAKTHPDFDLSQISRLQEILAAAAFEMMAQENYQYVVRGADRVQTLRNSASRRCSQAGIPQVDGRDWRMVKTATDLTDRCILEGFTDEMLGWKHRGMMEFYCGRYLARHAGDDAVPTLKRFANDPQWEWAWRFAIELPSDAVDPACWATSLGCLYVRPKTGPRPSELIYRSWPRMLQFADYLPAGENSEQDIASATATAQRDARDGLVDVRQPAGQALHALLGEYPRLLRGSGPERRTAEGLERGFRPIPPVVSSWRDLFGGGIRHLPRRLFDWLLGRHPSRKFRKHWVEGTPEIEIAPFLMNASPVTNVQYELFDGSHREKRDRYSGEDKCPVVSVSWYDGFCFSLWSHSRLPREEEWEYACRAGSSGAYCFGDKESELGKYAWYGEDLGIGKTHPVCGKLANAWGMYDVHGNAGEWCDSWYEEGGSNRVYRGGSWDCGASICRASLRYRDGPGRRYISLGFRLLRSVS